METFLTTHESNLPLPPTSGEDTIFEFVVDDKGQWEHWNNRVCSVFRNRNPKTIHNEHSKRANSTKAVALSPSGD